MMHNSDPKGRVSYTEDTFICKPFDFQDLILKAELVKMHNFSG